MAGIGSTTPTRPQTTKELQEQVWDLKEQLEDANALIESYAGQMQRLRAEVRTKDRELSELKSPPTAALAKAVKQKDKQMVDLEASVASFRKKELMLKQKTTSLQSGFQDLSDLVLDGQPVEASIETGQGALDTTQTAPLAAANTIDNLSARRDENKVWFNGIGIRVNPRSSEETRTLYFSRSPISKRAHTLESQDDSIEPRRKRLNPNTGNTEHNHPAALKDPNEADTLHSPATVRQLRSTRAPKYVDPTDAKGEQQKPKDPLKTASSRKGGLQAALNNKIRKEFSMANMDYVNPEEESEFIASL
ncbi:MAG: hypothetical protein Q9184_002492 [Pyrenodesmia sp. 2 TL-2023]